MDRVSALSRAGCPERSKVSCGCERLRAAIGTRSAEAHHHLWFGLGGSEASASTRST